MNIPGVKSSLADDWCLRWSGNDFIQLSKCVTETEETTSDSRTSEMHSLMSIMSQLNWTLICEKLSNSATTQLKSIFLKWTRIIYSSLMLSQVGVTSVSVDIVLIDTGLSHGHHCSTPILIVWRNVWISAWLPRHQPTHFVIFIIHNSGYWSLSCLSISGPGSGDPTDHATPHCHHTW